MSRPKVHNDPQRVSIVLDRDLLDHVDRVRKRRPKQIKATGRSAFIRYAIRFYLRGGVD